MAARRALALTALTGSFLWWLPASALLGVGTAMVYPTLIAAISEPRIRRAGALPQRLPLSSDIRNGVQFYLSPDNRFWRDLGYAVGALASGVIADIFGFVPAILAIAAGSVSL